ncbi:Eukaryotic translation initiation factor 3 subunit K [Phytophthora pseudosyringae]|uniref:Eukaryotic translation initiation factor 3 subunit K n=1 Tax=Phytophthora pseudosyringae TaxID=221518 RepID=A0A8T1W154_9STRA|nr:Eukaryotic translation initiation factor 3 subunit K [Phytophthora pseudosyringae]
MPAFQQQTIVDFVTAEGASPTQQQLQAVHNGRGFCEEANVKVLETYLAEQVQSKTVDIDANVALLKLYQVYPATVNAEKVATILVKGIMTLPSTFFTGASTMVPESIREDANVTAALHTGFMLQSCLFEDFWKEDAPFAEKVPGFLESVRAYIVTAISRSHSAISMDVVKAKLNVSDKEVADIVAAEKWTVADTLIQITPNENNQMQAKKVQENIEFEDVLKVIHTLSR